MLSDFILVSCSLAHRGQRGSAGARDEPLQFMDEGFSGVARTWSDGASGGDLVSFFVYLGLDVSGLSPGL